MAVVWSLAVLLIVGAVCQAAPARPVGYYTFDGKSLRPLNVVQRRSDDDGFSFGGRNGWKLPFAKPAFLSALTDRNEEERPTISSDHLLPDYLTHQEFLKPQLQAAGFSGGRIIAGPFPVPLAGLPKPPPRSGTVPPIPVTPATQVVSKVKFQQQQQQQQQTQTSIPTFVYKATPPPAASYKPVQFPAIQSVPAKIVAVRPPATQPQQQQQQAKLVYPIPASSSVHWHAAHQSGPERPASALGVASYSHPATLVSESAGGSTRLSYGGWTPIYSASYAHVQTQQESVPPVQSQSAQLHSQPELKSEGSSYLDGEEKVQEPVVIEALVPERQVVNQPEAQQSLDEDSQVVERLEPEVDLIPRVIITGSSPLSFESKKIRKEKQENKSDTPVVVVIAASSEDGPAEGPVESPSSNVPVVTEVKRTVRKRKAKQVPSSSSWKRRNSMESASDVGHVGRAVNQEVAIVTASSSYSADAPSPLLLPDSDSSSSALPALLSGRGQGQGRYVGRVLPASLFEDDTSAVLAPVEDQAVGSAPVGWRETVLL